MLNSATTSILGFGVLVYQIVVSADRDIVVDGSVPGAIVTGRGGMVCNTLAVAAALGAAASGIVACGDDLVGAELCRMFAAENVAFEKVMTAATPITLSLVNGTNRSLVVGHSGVREPQLSAVEVSAAWDRYRSKPDWVFMTLPALDSAAGTELVRLATAAGSSVAVTLSNADHVADRSEKLETLLTSASIVFANNDEWSAVPEGCRIDCPVVVTAGAGPAVVRFNEEFHLVSPRVAPLVLDTTGAGDAFAAGVLTFYKPGSTIEGLLAAVAFGHEAAAVIITKLGSSTSGVTHALSQVRYNPTF